MKFFTPELLTRFGSDDPAIAEAAEAELEVQADEYLQALGKIEQELPPRFRDLLDRYYLHDARVLSAAGFSVTDAEVLVTSFRNETSFGNGHHEGRERRAPTYGLHLQLDVAPKELLVLQYRSVLLEALIRHDLVGDDCPYIEWLHDEVELVPSAVGRAFRHSILFTNGWELRLTFQDFDFAVLRPMQSTEEIAGAGLPIRAQL